MNIDSYGFGFRPPALALPICRLIFEFSNPTRHFPLPRCSFNIQPFRQESFKLVITEEEIEQSAKLILVYVVFISHPLKERWLTRRMFLVVFTTFPPSPQS